MHGRQLSIVLLACSLGLAACSGSSGGATSGGGTGGGGGGGTGGTVSVSGTVTFDRPGYTGNNLLDFNNLQRLPVRSATVEILRASDQSVLAQTATDAVSGRYSASITGTPFIVRVKAQMLKTGSGGYDLEVRNNTANNALYSLDSSVVTPSTNSVVVDLNAPTGWGGTSYTGTRAAAPFAILYMLSEATQLLQAAEPALTLPALNVYWSTSNRSTECADGQPDPTTGAIGTTFYVGGTLPATAGCAATPRGIYVLGDASSGAGSDADEFDSSVIAHELGHYYQDEFSRDDSMGGPHYLDARHDLRLAFSEGWGNAFQGFVLGSPWYRDTFGPAGNSGFAFDMENNSAPYQNLAEFGFFAETSVQDILWDVFDGANDDQVNLGFGPIHTVMRNEMVSSDAMTSIFVMANGLETRNPAQAAAIGARLAASPDRIAGNGDYGAGEAPVGASTNNGWPADPDAVPVYRQVTFGTPVTVLSTDRFADPGDSFYGAYNRLGGRRYLRIDLPASSGLRISAQGPAGSDPDFYLYRQGVDQCPQGGPCSGFDDSAATGLEEATYAALPAGSYVLEVEECSNLGELCRPGPARGDTDISVTVTQQ